MLFQTTPDLDLKMFLIYYIKTLLFLTRQTWLHCSDCFSVNSQHMESLPQAKNDQLSVLSEPQTVSTVHISVRL